MEKNKFSWPFRAITLLLTGIQSIIGIMPFGILSLAGSQAYASTAQVPDNQQALTVIRRPSLHEPRSILPHFSSPPTATELFTVHIFPVALVPMGNPKPSENQALVNTLISYVHRKDPEDRTAIINFMQKYPDSAWKPVLLLNLGIIYRQTGYFSRARDAWAEAWDLSKHSPEIRSKALADRAVGELVQLYAWIGGYDELQPIFKEIGDRKLMGGSAEMLADARDGLSVMNHSPQAGFLCGPFALEELLSRAQPGARSSVLLNAKSTRNGVSLTQLKTLADRAGMHMEMAKHALGNEFIVGSVVHWKLNHYGAILQENNGHYLVGDATFSEIYGKQLWISKAALEEESDGYFLVPAGPLPKGWTEVSKEEGQNVWGKGTTTTRDNDSFPKCNCDTGLMAGGDNDDPNSNDSSNGEAKNSDSHPHKNPGSTPGNHDEREYAINTTMDSPDNYGMAGYQMTALDAGLFLTDTPLRYKPPVGPSIKFKVIYNQRDPYLDPVPNYSNLGAQWSFGWFTYITDDGSGSLNTSVARYDNNVGLITYTISNSITGVYYPDRFGNVLQFNTSSNSYTLTYPDGSQQVFGYANTLEVGDRWIFLTTQSDASGNTLTFNYDGDERLAYVNDCLGQTTTLYYDAPEDLYKITRIEDPFGRFAYFHYDEEWRLQKITDEIGISSAFSYDSGDFVTQLTTPYGLTSFSYGDSDPTGSDGARWLYVTDPNGDHEYLYSPPTADTDTDATNNSDSQAPASVGPASFSNANLIYRNSFYFTKAALSTGTTNDFQNAIVYHWLHDNESSGSPTESGILESVRPPLESRIYYWYPGQSSDEYSSGISLRTPCVVARLVDNAANTNAPLTQAYQYSFNSQGRVTQFIDPLGRQTTFNYYANGIDLQNVQQADAGSSDLVAQFGTYNSQHLPLTYTNSAGLTYTLKWNSYGQLTNLTDPNFDVISYNHDSDGFLKSIVRTGGGLSATNSFGYDFFDRPAAVTNAAGYFLTVNYDNLNRITQITHPDGTSENYVYNILDLFAAYDRTGNRTVWTYDATRRLITMRDRLNRLTQYSWCGCGGLASVTDPLGDTTSWSHDIEGRVTEKIYADSSSIFYTYEPFSGRLHSITDPENQIKNYVYNLDDTLTNISYADAIVSTPSVSFIYDTNYNRLTSMFDGTGQTLYNYYPITGTVAPGAGQLETVSNLFANATIIYKYDNLGRATNRSIGTANEGTLFDGLSRPTNNSSILGTFSYSYNKSNFRLNSISYPNGQLTSFGYTNILGDQMLLGITNKNPSGTILSQFNYQHDVLRRITQWLQISTNVVQTNNLQYDAEGQLQFANVAMPPESDGTPQGLSFGYEYDSSGNRVSSQTEFLPALPTLAEAAPTTVNRLLYNNLNQMTNITGSDPLPVTFRGTLNQPATVTVSLSTNLLPGGSWTPPTLVQTANVYSNPASDGGGQYFTSTVNVPSGNYGPSVRTNYPSLSSFSPVSIIAQSGSYYATNAYCMTVLRGPWRTCKYDANGNCTNVSMAHTNTSYQWDAQNRLAAINTYITNTTTLQTTKFSYDGFSRWCQIVTLSNSVVQSTQRFVWCGTQLCQARDGGNNVQKQFFRNGESIGGTNYYYQKDHLGSVWSMADSGGITHAWCSYDPYGQQTQIGGDMSSDFGFAGYYHHAPSGLYLTVYRAYDPISGRWLNHDPIGERGGLNLYDYVGNNPTNLKDPKGQFTLLDTLIAVSVLGMVAVGVYDFEKTKGKEDQGESEREQGDNINWNKWIQERDNLHGDPNNIGPKHWGTCAGSAAQNIKLGTDVPLTSFDPPFDQANTPPINDPELQENVETAGQLSGAAQQFGEQAADSSDDNTN